MYLTSAVVFVTCMRRLIVCIVLHGVMWRIPGRRSNVSSRFLELTGSLRGTQVFFFTHFTGQVLTGPDAWLTFSNALLFF